MAVDPGNNNNNLSEEEKIREAIKKLIDELNDSLKEQGLSDRQREASVKIYKDLLEDAGTNATKLESIQKDLNIELNGSSGYARDFGNEVSLVVERLNEAIESITNQSDLSQRILSTFKKTRQVANSIADDADLSYVRSVKYMENQSDVLSVQEKRLKAQALEGAQALQLINTTSKAAEIARQMQHYQNELNAAYLEGNLNKVTEIEQNIESLKQKETILSLTETALDKAREGKKLSEEEVESLKTYTTTTENLSELDKKRILSAIEFNNELVDGVNNFAALQNAIQKSIEREDELNRRMGVTGAIMDGFSKIPGFSAIFKSEDVEHVKDLAREAYVEQKRFADLAANDKLAILEIEKEIKDLEKEKPEGYEAEIETLKTTRERHIASKKVNEEASRNVQLTTRSQIMGKLLTKSIGNLTDALTDPATIFTFLVTKGLQFNSEVTDISKNLGVTETQATKIRNEFTSISANTMDTAINSERLLQAQSDLNKELSLGVQFSGDTLVNFVRLTEKIGLSAQQAAKLTLASASTGESATEFAGKSALAAAQQAKTLGITVNMKEIMSDTADLTNEQLILFGRQPEAIGKTLAKVKKLGIELGDLNAISGKLLDFQGSIESELEAELLTGKQLNLERARAAALAGDQATLAKEIASQVGTIGEFESMNVLQRQKMAEALGMNVNQLSGVLIRQEAINKGIAGAKDLTDEQLTAAKQLADSQDISMAEAVVKIQEQRSAQDKFNDAVIKLQRLFGELLAGPVGELLDAIVDVATVIIGPIAAGLNFILTPVKMFTEFLTKVPNLLKVAAAAMLFLNFDSALSGFGKLKEKLISLPGLIPPIPPIIPGGGDIPGGGAILPPGIPGGSGPIPGAVTDQASGIIFDERMTGKGRFKDLDTGRMVSEKAANEAGVFKPFNTPEVPKPGDVSPTPSLDPVREGGEDIVNIPQSPDDGSMLKEKMKNIAEGLKYFASMEVVKGALALLIASPGLYVLSKAADGLNKLGEVKGEALQEAMKGIAEGVEEFGTVKVILGSIGLLIASPGLVLLGASAGGIKKLADIEGGVVEEALGGLAEGVSKFGSAKVVLGAIGLTIASPGLVLMGVSAGGIKKISDIEGNVIKDSLGGLAKGVKKFGSAQIMLGAIGLTIASPGLVLLGLSSKGLKSLDSIKPKKIKEAMAGIANGVSEFATTKVALGAIGILLASPGLVILGAGSLGLKALDSIKPKKIKEALSGIAKGVGEFATTEVVLGAIGLTIAAPSLLLLGLASIPLKIAEKLNGKSLSAAMRGIANGIKSFGNPKVILGGLALIPISLALATMAVGAIGLGAIALLGAPAAAGMAALTAGLTALGTAAATGVPFLGVALIGAFGLALIPFGAALGLAAPAIEAIGTVIASTIMSIANAIVTVIPALTQGLIDLSNNVSISGLIGLALTLPLLAGGLTIFGAALIPIGLASIGLLMVSKSLKPIAEIAPKLNLANIAIKGIATSIALLATSLNTLDASVLEPLADIKGNVNVITTTTNATEPKTPTATPITTTTVEPVIPEVVPVTTVEPVIPEVVPVTTTSTISEPVSSLANLITKQNTLNNTEIVPGISVTTPPTTTTQETLTTNTENLSVATSNATANLEKLNIATLNTLPPVTLPTTPSPTQLAPNTNITEIAPVNLEPPTEIVPGISVTTPNPENNTVPALERILTLTTEQINTAIGVLTTTTPTLDTLKAQAGLVDLRDGQQDIATEKFSDKSLEIINAVINTVTKLGTNTELQQIGEKISGAEISTTQGVGIKEERVKLFKTQAPETSNTIESPKSLTSEQTNDSQVFIDNIQPMIAETVTSTINAMLPPMVAALKEGQGKVKVVNDSFNSSGQKGDINTIRRFPSDNFA
jgi:hypothetical protein